MTDRPILTFDFETRSVADLKKVGTWAYSEHPTTDIICLGWGYDHNPRHVWWPEHACPGFRAPTCDVEQGMPTELYCAIEDGAIVEAHNIPFEYSIWKNVMVARYGWIEIPDEAWRDTMAVACYYAMPAGLDKLSRVLGFPGKPADAGKLITMYSKLHLKKAKHVIPHHDFERWINYVDSDVAEEQAVSDKLGDLPARELPVFQLNQKINRRGLYLDLEGIEAATRLSDKKATALTNDFKAITGCGPRQHVKALTWFKENGLPELEDLQKGTIKELLAPENNMRSGPVRTALKLRLDINKASAGKLYKMAMQRGSDGRSRFQTRYHGAGTGRETASGWQVLNMSRGYEKVDPDLLVADIMTEDMEYLDMLYGNSMDAIGKATRHWIMAEKGNRITAGDYSSIEAVGLACNVGEEWKIKAFAQKYPIYCLAACKIFKMDPQIAIDLGDDGFKKAYGPKRQVGKIGELAFGYQGALGAWLGFDSSGAHSDDDIIGYCKAWRADHPCTVAHWRGMENAAIEAVAHPGKQYGHRDTCFEVVDDGDGLKWLTMILPNGKRLWYFQPQLRSVMPKWHNVDADPDCAAGTCDCKAKPQVTYMAWKFGGWRRVASYGGKWTENETQAISRELLMPAALELDRAGYSLVLTVYDEIVSEDREGFGSLKEFENIMIEARPDFARSWPIMCEGWEGNRYRK